MKVYLLISRLSVTAIILWLNLLQVVLAGTQCGTAAYYDQGTVTANGEQFNPQAFTAAHRWLPLNSWIKIVDQKTKRSIRVRINDRGPWDGVRILDMTPAVINAIDPKRTADIRYVCIHWQFRTGRHSVQDKGLLVLYPMSPGDRCNFLQELQRSDLNSDSNTLTAPPMSHRSETLFL